MQPSDLHLLLVFLAHLRRRYWQTELVVLTFDLFQRCRGIINPKLVCNSLQDASTPELWNEDNPGIDLGQKFCFRLKKNHSVLGRERLFTYECRRYRISQI